jgi:programmed cell death 6-interacting protein
VNISRAERDNDLIYHHDVPPSSALPPIQEAAVAQSTIPAELQDARSAVNGDRMIFGEMLGWGAREAISEFARADNF